MQRCKTLRWCVFMVLLLQAPVCIRTQLTGSTTPKSFPALEIIAPKGAPQPTYFFMDPNGSYKYAFDTGSGIASEQSANQANEVTGQYSYYENGVPYMVKYKAGIQGYQAEIIPGSTTAPQTNRNAFSARAQLIDTAQRTTASSTTTPETLPLLNPTSQLTLRQTLPQGGNGNGNNAATLQFVQDMVRSMQSQPIQLSFSSQHAHLQHGFPLSANTAAKSGTTRLLPQSSVSTSTNKADFRQIGSLTTLNGIGIPSSTAATFKASAVAAAAAAAEHLMQPYAFSYSSEQSARSESADQSGTVIGKYSYYDEAGFHELNYKAGDGIGFVVLGGNLGAAQKAAAAQKPALNNVIAATAGPPFLAINVPQAPNPNYSYSIFSSGNTESRNIRRTDDTEGIRNRNTFEQNGRSLRKFRRHVQW